MRLTIPHIASSHPLQEGGRGHKTHRHRLYLLHFWSLTSELILFLYFIQNFPDLSLKSYMQYES